MNRTKKAGVLTMLGAAVGLSAAVFTPAALADHHEQGEKMKAKVGHAAPDFTLTDTEGKSHTLSKYTAEGKVVVLEWFNAGCPFVVRHHDTHTTMKDIANSHQGRVVWLAINSGAPGEQGHGMDKEAKSKWGIPFPILIDESGDVGRLYGAKTTPHMFIIDAKGVLVYNGAIDDDPRGNKSPGERTNYVSQALGEVLSGKPVSQAETRPYGCSVKYGKKGA